MIGLRPIEFTDFLEGTEAAFRVFIDVGDDFASRYAGRCRGFSLHEAQDPRHVVKLTYGHVGAHGIGPDGDRLFLRVDPVFAEVDYLDFISLEDVHGEGGL